MATKPTKKKYRFIGFRPTADMAKRLERLAADTGRKSSDIIRECIMRHLAALEER